MTQAQMDAAAEVDRGELAGKLNDWSAMELAEWWERNFLAAGHKRLGRILLKLAHAEQEVTADVV